MSVLYFRKPMIRSMVVFGKEPKMLALYGLTRDFEAVVALAGSRPWWRRQGRDCGGVNRVRVVVALTR